jgi:hypothetical protein
LVTGFVIVVDTVIDRTNMKPFDVSTPAIVEVIQMNIVDLMNLLDVADLTNISVNVVNVVNVKVNV